MTRKSPIRHRVKGHTRQNSPVRSYTRGTGVPKPKLVKKKLRSPKQRILDTHRDQVKNNKIYHLTNNIEEILKSNELKGSKLWGTVSFTASSTLVKPHLYPGRKKYRIVLDLKKLLQDYPTLVPRYYSYTDTMPEEVKSFYQKHGYTKPDKLPNVTNLHCHYNFSYESEWVVDRPIKNVNKYITGVEEIG
jgi:hypothetical protein